jgi:RNA-directed DNA polymerase
MLRAGVMEDGAVHRDDAGTPQGGVISPCLCNVYLHRLDRQWTERGSGVLVRFADDLVVLCHNRREAEAALAALRSILADMGLSLKQAKTRIVHLREGGEGLDFLGFHHHRVRGERGYEHLRFLARWPSREAMSRARNRIRELTGRKRALLPVEDVVQEVNDYLRGWANYYRYGNSRLHFTKIRTYALRRLVLFAAKRHNRTSRYGWTVVNYHSRNQLGLISLDQLVVTPGPFRDWRVKRGRPNAGGEGRR